MSEHRARSNDCGTGECLANRTLTGSFRTIELGCRGWRSVEVRYVNQPRDANVRGNLGNALSTFDVHVVIREISLGRRSRLAMHSHENIREGNGVDTLCLIITTDEIVHDIRVPNAFRNLFLVANVPFLLEAKIVAGAIVNIYTKKHHIGERTIDTI